MKILYILSGTGMQGGATKSFLAMADGVAAAGNEVRVVAPDDRGVTSVVRERGWKVFVVPYRFSCLPGWSNWRDRLLFLPRLCRNILLNRKAHKLVKNYVEEYRPDIVHDNTSVTDVGHQAARHIGATHVIHVREYGWKDFRMVITHLAQRLHYPKAAIIAITDELRSLRGRQLPADRQITIYNGVVGKNSFRYNAAKQDYFLYAGRVTEDKGCADLIDAYIGYCGWASESGRKPLRLIMAGSLTHEPITVNRLKERLRASGYAGNVEWLGEIKEVGRYMELAAATVIPSKYEGFGRVMPEAMAAGSLCIARDTGGTAEQLTNGRRLCGHEVALSFRDKEQLMELMKEVDDAYRGGEAFGEEEKYGKIIRDSQDVVRSLYLVEEVGNKTLEFYNKLLKQDCLEDSGV